MRKTVFFTFLFQDSFRPCSSAQDDKMFPCHLDSGINTKSHPLRQQVHHHWRINGTSS